ncbi:MAG TPA: transglutaminase-like domain-containing protein [Candidatus Koribacter sp.]
MRKLFPFILAVLTVPAFAQASRHFIFHYGFTVRNLEPGQRAEIWFPQAHSDEFQDVRVVSANGDLPLHMAHAKRFGNLMYHAVAAKATKSEYNFDVVYDVVRRERIGLPRDGVQPHLLKASARETREFLGPEKLVPVTGKLAEIAAVQVQGKNSTLDKASALYGYVFTTMKYDKTGTGWGRGDAEWACDSKRGNCTDFHSVFISMARSQHIPARFEIGFSLPAAKHSGEIPGYHCWAEFYDAQYGWVPVDISEAWKDPAKKEYFFGAHDVNRVQFSMGRDLELAPKQAGDALNYFVYPYVEVNGKAFANVANRFSFEDHEAETAANR